MELSAARELKEIISLRLPPYVTLRSDGRPAIVGVGVAPAERAGDFRIAVRARLEGDLTPGAIRFLKRATAREFDLRVTGPITPRSRPLIIGATTAHTRGCWGTVGFFARRNADGREGFVSNNHVIAREDDGVDGDDVIHPDGGGGRPDVVGRLSGDYPLLKGGPKRVDCAFARLVPGVDVERASLGRSEQLRSTAAPAVGPVVVGKVGQTTGRTDGRMSAFMLTDVQVDYSFGAVQFQDQIEIESLTTAPFSRGGDSGSLIFTRDHQPLGLLFAGSFLGGTTDSGLTYANPIGEVFEALGITLMT